MIYKCKICGGTLEVTEGMTVCECEYCGTPQTLPKTTDDVVTNLFNRANNLRLKCDFDKAQEIYEKIAVRHPEEAEAYWGIVLCKYGIEYVGDPTTLVKIPTCHRTQLESVRTDVDYLAALEHADSVQHSLYEKEALAIDALQKNILQIVHKEKPFDVFLCYKETDAVGKRTPDSVIANDIYHHLTQEGFKVFYAAISLEDKLGQAYEPYIFAALNSARIMLVIGTKPEYFSAVWLKNEWSRYLKIMKNDRTKLLIPCYKDMDAYDLPEEFSHLQAQDMSKIGFINDVIRGIRKVLVKEDKPVVQQTVIQTSGGSANTENLLKRGMLCLEDGKWTDAEQFFEQVLNENVEEPRAYLGKLLAELKLRSEAALSTQVQSFARNDNFIKACRFGDYAFRERLKKADLQSIYNGAEHALQLAKNDEDYRLARDIFESISGYADAAEKAKACETQALEYLYQDAVKKLDGARTNPQFLCVRAALEKICDYKDAAQMIEECERRRKETLYQNAVWLMRSEVIDQLYTATRDFESLKDYKDSRELAKKCRERIWELEEFAEINRRIEEAEKLRKQALADNAVKRKHLLVILVTLGILAFIIFLYILIMVILPNQRYQNAMALYESGQYSAAITAFEEMGDYKDAEEMAMKAYRSEALVPLRDAEVGDVVDFSGYRWIVLTKSDVRMLVIKENNLTTRPYNYSITDDLLETWETCEVREFLQEAFSDCIDPYLRDLVVKEKIRTSIGSTSFMTSDRFFLLSAAEAEEYMTQEQIELCDNWWVREGYYFKDGELGGMRGAWDSDRGVRPAMYISLQVE